MTERCLICDKDIVNDRCVVFVKGIDRMSQKFTNKTSGVVHSSCRKHYTRPDTIADDLKTKMTALEQSCRPSREFKLDFKHRCFCCCEVINEDFDRKQRKKPIQKREKVFDVRTLEIKENISKTANERGDKWGEQVSR